MVNARGQDMQAGRFPDVLADRRRALQSNKEATTKTATDLLQRIDGKKEDGIVRHEKRLPRKGTFGPRARPRAPWPGPGRWDVAQGESRRAGRGESLASQRPLTAS